MAAYLQPRILGVLAHFDSQLLNASIPMEEKRPVGGCLLFVAIDSSFNDLIVMCKHVLSMVMMILTLLYFFTSLLSFLPDSGKPDFHYPADGFQDHQWHTAQGDEHTEDWPPDNGRGLHRDLVSGMELLCTQVRDNDLYGKKNVALCNYKVISNNAIVELVIFAQTR